MAYINKGLSATEEAALNGAVKALVERFDPAEIWLFGSRARGDARQDSDYDLLLVHRPDVDDPDDFSAPHIAVAALDIAADVVPCSAQAFREAHSRRAGLIPHILATGKRVYHRGR